VSDYFAKQVSTPVQHQYPGPQLTLDEQIAQKAKTGLPPMGIIPPPATENVKE